MIETQALGKRYGDLVAVDGITFKVEPGQVLGFLGPNGAGKSTTMKMITGYLVPSEGQLAVDGHDVVSDPVAAQRLIGYLPESNPIYPEMSVQDYLVFIGRMRGLKNPTLNARLKFCVDACGLQEKITATIRTLSKGFKQRVGIAQAIIHDPDILILDEPTSGLDPNQIAEIRHLIRDLGRDKTVILSTHILSEVEETCSRALMIVGGRIAVDDRIDALAGGRGLRLAVHGSGSVEEATATIRALDSVAGVEAESGDDLLQRFKITPRGDAEISRELFRLAVREGWEISELTRERRSLADVFREASQKGATQS